MKVEFTFKEKDYICDKTELVKKNTCIIFPYQSMGKVKWQGYNCYFGYVIEVLIKHNLKYE